LAVNVRSTPPFPADGLGTTTIGGWHAETASPDRTDPAAAVVRRPPGSAMATPRVAQTRQPGQDPTTDAMTGAGSGDAGQPAPARVWTQVVRPETWLSPAA